MFMVDSSFGTSKKSIFKNLFSVFGVKLLLLAVFLSCLFACSNADSDMLSGCSDGHVCTNLKAYSFVYYKDKNTLDTVTATTNRISCKIYDGYFECDLMKVWSCMSFVYDMQLASGGGKKTAVQEDIPLTLVDTTFINYGEHRLMDYIPPYEERPALDVKKMREAFDTVVVALSSYDTIYRGQSKEFYSWYDLEDEGMPEWMWLSGGSVDFYVFDGSDGTPDADTVFSRGDVITYLSSCSFSDTTFVHYPRPFKAYSSHVYFTSYLREDYPTKDTTISWYATYTNDDGKTDSIEVETFLKMNVKTNP